MDKKVEFDIDNWN